MYKKTCLYCGLIYETQSLTRLFCSKNCSQKFMTIDYNDHPINKKSNLKK